jgi:formylglycine-generating enzyme required for sulfatase activity
MVELRKTGANQYEVLTDKQVIGQVWNWHGSWSAQANGETYHGLKSRKQAIARAEDIHRLRR